jgi:uncharacterized protein (TIGR02596 family)
MLFLDPKPLPRRKCSLAFSLIEMLIVLAMVSMLLVMAAPSLNGVLNAYRLSSAGDTMMGMISEAQQLASSSNKPIEIRFFKYADEFGGNPSYRACMLFRVDQAVQGTGASATTSERLVPQGNLIKLPSGTMLVSDTDLSPLLQGDGPKDTAEGKPNGYSGVKDATYMALRFMTDGSCRKVLPVSSAVPFAQLAYQALNQSYFTIVIDQGGAVNLGNLPKNFYTIQIDPFTSKARSYKPGV